MGQIGGALVLVAALSLAGGTASAWAEEKPAKAEKAEKKAVPEEAVPSWVNWFSAGLPFDFQLTRLDVEGGYRFIGGDNSAAKFQEYRVLEENPYFDHAAFSLETKDKKRYVEFYMFDPFKNDQSFNVRAGKYGDYELEIFWDQIPHLLSTTGRTLFTTTETDNTASLTLPPGVASAVQAASATGTPSPRAVLLNGFLNSGAVPVDLESTTSNGGFKFKYNLTDSLDLGLRYTYTQKEGTVPFGAGFGSPGGSVVELPAPLSNQTQTAEAKLQYARPGWNVGLGYTGSYFTQRIDDVIFDNPLQAVNTTTLSSQGRTTMDPSNQSSSVFLMGGISLPLRTRFTGKFAYTWRSQDDPFVQHTINPVLLALTPGSPGNPCPGITTSTCLQLPSSSLNADVQTTLVTFNVSSRPFALPLTLNGGFRYFDYHDGTQEIEFLTHVVRDQGPLVVDTTVNAPFSYTKYNAYLDAGYQLLRNLNAKLGFGWERWDRNPDHREVPTSDEYTLRTSLDYSPLDWLLLRAAYRVGWRYVDEYNTQAHQAHVVEDVEGEEFTIIRQGQSVLGRKYDEWNRIRNRVELLASLTPLESLNFNITYGLNKDEYDKSRCQEPTTNVSPCPQDTSPLGLEKFTGWSLGADVAYTPFQWLSLFASYMREENQYDQLSRSRPVTGSTTFDFVDFNWRSVSTDVINTYGVGADATLIPNRLNFKLMWTYSDADTIIKSFNPVTPTSGTAAQNLTATAVNFPTDNTNLNTLTAALRYYLTKNWSMKAEFQWERFRESNWQTDTLGLTGPTNLAPTTDVYLGAKFLQNYDAYIGALTLRYQF
jgi:MtrB/PioB family decaheme-associated outer membrane protein